LAAVTHPRAGLSMAELVERTGVGAPTIRFYLAEGLLPAPERRAANRFVYDERHVELLRLIRLLRERRRLSLPAIRELLPELLPDLTGSPEGGVFRPEMWRQLLSPATASVTGVRERIVEAALTAFSARGYFDVSIEDLCRAAGIAKGSFYRHFAAKDELLVAVVQRAVERVRESLVESSGLTTPLLGSADRLTLALLPFRTLVFDLASLSSQGRSPQVQSLGALLESLADLVGSDDRVHANLVVDRVLAQLLRTSAPVVDGCPEGAAALPETR
jgi:AcrR family transcriptional regulator